MLNTVIKPISSLNHMIDAYDAFIIDLWGVVHDGRDLYPGALAALDYLRQHHKKILFLSNAPRRASKAVQGLERLGVPNTAYDKVLTSGETVFEWMTSRPFPEGSRFKMIGPDRDDDLLDELPIYHKVHDIADADFAIVTGYDDDASDEEEKTPQLKVAISRNIPLICANPDMVIVRLDGTRALCAGVIAQKYADMGGDVTYYGKPYTHVYNSCFQFFAEEYGIENRSRICAIGDNIDTDIQGGNNAGIDTYFIASGILGEQLGITHGELPDEQALHAYCAEKNITPYGVLPGLLV